MNTRELWNSLSDRQRTSLKVLGRQTTPVEGGLKTGKAVPFGTGRTLKRLGLALYVSSKWRVSELGQTVLSSIQFTIRR